MSTSADEQPVREIRANGHVYRWGGDLNEWTAVTVDGGEAVPFHALVSQTNGWILEQFADAGVDL